MQIKGNLTQDLKGLEERVSKGNFGIWAINLMVGIQMD